MPLLYYDVGLIALVPPDNVGLRRQLNLDCTVVRIEFAVRRILDAEDGGLL